jgi:BED zinc finger
MAASVSDSDNSRNLELDSTSANANTAAKLVKKLNSTSKIWNFFGFDSDTRGYPIDNGKPKCRSCLREISCKSGNTSNLLKHLRHVHPKLYGDYSTVRYTLLF